jgi:CheY-like chemotaxis protein
MVQATVPTDGTVLVVDDEIDIRVLVRITLEAAGLGLRVVAEAIDGHDALATYDELDPPPVPSVVILDNRMPGYTGIEVAREIRRRLGTQHIILFSAFLTPAVEAEAQAAGVDVCVAKLDVGRLPQVVASLTRAGAPNTGQP